MSQRQSLRQVIAQTSEAVRTGPIELRRAAEVDNASRTHELRLTQYARVYDGNVPDTGWALHGTTLYRDGRRYGRVVRELHDAPLLVLYEPD